MKKRTIISLALLVLLTTITLGEKIAIPQFNLKKIIIENNALIKEKDIRKLLAPYYGKNLIFLKNKEIEKALIKNSFIDSFNIKKKYPSTLKIKIFEKKPIAVLLNKKKKFYLSDKVDYIEFNKKYNFKDLPYVFGTKEMFKILYNDLKKEDFPMSSVTKFTLYESKRWDIETKDKKIIKLPVKNYLASLRNFMNIIHKKEFKNYKVFDYRIEDQLILK